MKKHHCWNCALIGTGSLLLVTLIGAGCTTAKTTTTPRTATEQLLLSTATDHALKDGGLEVFAGRKVHLDMAYFDSVDAKYVQGSVRDALSRAGALLTDSTNADVIIEPRSGGLGIDESETFLGIPSLTLPIPLAGSAQTPEMALYKASRQRSVAKFALVAYRPGSGQHIYSTGPLDGKSFDLHYRLLFISWIRTDVPEKKRSDTDARKAQTWSPQYDERNWGTNSPAQ